MNHTDGRDLEVDPIFEQDPLRGGVLGNDIVSGEVTFNARGGIASATNLRFVGGPQYNTTFASRKPRVQRLGRAHRRRERDG